MKISISTIKKDKVYNILYVENPQVTGVTKQQFEQTVKRWIQTKFAAPYSTFTAVEPDLYSFTIILDINSEHEDFQRETEIS